MQLYVRDPAGNLIELDYPDASTIPKDEVPEYRVLADVRPQEGDALRATLWHAGRERPLTTTKRPGRSRALRHSPVLFVRTGRSGSLPAPFGSRSATRRAGVASTCASVDPFGDRTLTMIRSPGFRVLGVDDGRDPVLPVEEDGAGVGRERLLRRLADHEPQGVPVAALDVDRDLAAPGRDERPAEEVERLPRRVDRRAVVADELRPAFP